MRLRGVGRNRARVTTHARLEPNLAASHAARDKRRFSEFAAIDRELTPFKQYMRFAETLAVSTALNKAVFMRAGISRSSSRAWTEAFAKAAGRAHPRDDTGCRSLDEQRIYERTG